ncbi:hypothetical protein HCN44_003929 [Aphidius gifuensis]|uniref:Uncharacterized protein n=1 Tax=Aphidius gifuensis TaxID=684658 RepID=A0A835CSM1_APHGI|nr:hypothetical protein HCN44_003929 [Aphidius gifuensis]
MVLSGKVVDKPKHVRHEKDGVKTSRFDSILISVETQKLDVKISDPTVSTILPGAFGKSKEIKYLSLNFMKGPILFGKHSFKGLNMLKALEFEDSLVTLYDDTFTYMPSLVSISMSLSEFTTELKKKFDTLTYLMILRIYNGYLENIKAYTFNSNNKNMTFLELSSCSIFLIEPKAFAALINLVMLDLSNNTLMRIAPGIFDGLSKLTTLKLKNNNIYKIQETALNGLVELLSFDISYNDLTEIALTAFHHLKIEDFMLNNNRLKIIEKGLFNYPNSNMIRNIYLQNNFIDKIDDGAFAGLDIMILNLAGNKFEFIGNKIFEGCKEMRLSEFTTELANKFDNLHNLTELRIKSGHLENIKAYTFHSNNKNMTLLELSSCSIFLIEPKAFAALINLVTLDLSNNTLMRIAPGTFHGLSELKNLNLTNNNLYRIQKTAFNGLVQLTTFDIFYNDLTEIALTTFHYLKIEDFMLNNNRLKKIAKGLFNCSNSNMTKNIYLQNNFIDKIDDGAFAGLDIMILDLTGNNLGFIGNKMFKGCKGILQLNLSGNPIKRILNNPFNNCKINEIIFFIDDKQSLEELVSKKVPDSIQIYWKQ